MTHAIEVLAHPALELSILTLLVIIAGVDGISYIIPNKLLILNLICICLEKCVPPENFGLTIWLDSLAGGLAGGLFLGAIYIVSKGRAIGMGDVKLVIVLGLWLGLVKLCLVVYLAFILGGVIGIGMMLVNYYLGYKSVKCLPFAPCLVIASVIVWGYGELLWSQWCLFW